MRNKIAFALTIAGGLVLFFGAISFIVVGVNLNWWIAAADLAGTIIFGLLLLGFGEQIQLTADVHNELINIKRIVSNRSSKQTSDSHSTNKVKQPSVDKAEQSPVNNAEQSVTNAKEYAAIDKPSTDGKIVCPKCGTVQNSNRTVCFKCGVLFIDSSNQNKDINTLSQKLEYALQFTTEDEMVDWLNRNIQSFDEADRPRIREIINKPNGTVRKEIKDLLDWLRIWHGN